MMPAMSDQQPPVDDHDGDRPADQESETKQRPTDALSGTTRSATNRPSDQADMAPLAEVIAELTRENRELAAAAAKWQERARFLGERLQALETGLVAGESENAPGAHASGAVAAEAATTTAKWRRWWRRMTGGAVDLS
jgi:hypothetical protein